MRVPFLLLFLAVAGPAAAQEPRLPAPSYPGATLESLQGQTGLEASVLRARLLARAGRYRESGQAWTAVAAGEPLLASFARAEALRAQIDAGDLDAAVAAIAAAAETPPADVLLRAADASRAAGALARAADLYRRARTAAGSLAGADEARLGLASMLEQTGEARGALEVYRDLQKSFRQPSAFEQADAAARRLSKQLGDPVPLGEADYDAITSRLMSMAAFRRAIDLLAEWQTRFPASAKGADVDRRILQSLYSLRANDEARAYAQSIIKKRGPGPEAAAAYRTVFSLDVREGDSDAVERRGFALLDGEVPGASRELRRAAGRQLAEYLVSVGRYQRGLQAYSRLYAITTARGQRIDLLWRMAVASLRAGNRARAIARLRQVRRLKLDSETDRASLYWLAYALNAGGAKAEARRLWTDLVKRFPFSYYGVRAAETIDAPAAEPSLTFPALALDAGITAQPDYRTAAILSRAGLVEEAAIYARRLVTAFRGSPAVALMAARASEAAGDPSAASLLMLGYFGDYLEQPASELPEDFWRLAYPLAYWNEITAAAARYDVDPLLMLAIARQESHFERTARSPVGAIGLFQIMPQSAADLDPAFDAARAGELLVRPDTAAGIAAALLAQNLARFDGKLAPTIASYNADKDRVQVWWTAARALPEELFVDGIPYVQTRSYVRQVLANYAMYQRYGARSASPKK